MHNDPFYLLTRSETVGNLHGLVRARAGHDLGTIGHSHGGHGIWSDRNRSKYPQIAMPTYLPTALNHQSVKCSGNPSGLRNLRQA